ncbi:ribosome small subunit-dependent GTPase A [bacterium]|nr:ribosome small subunit-dependent GTPase A [bacterium]
MIGQVYKIYSDSYFVNAENKITSCKIREIIKKQKTSIVTGDYVEFYGDVINKILPRKNFIIRPSVSNVDQIVVVSALKQPELDFHQLNRYISLAKYYKIPVVLCFNKEDLEFENNLKDRIEKIYKPLGYKILFTSALEKLGIQDFSSVLKGKLSALCGNSGVGKSSLINALNPKVKLKTKSVSEKLNRGTHTTRHCEIIPISNDTAIIDTPGFSNVKFDFILPRDVDLLFDDIFQYKSLCKYSDCLHINEQGCEVLNHMEQIDHTRYESYLEFVKEAFEYKEKVKYNGIKEESSQKFHHNRTVAKISEKKRQVSRNTQRQRVYKEIENEY